MVTSVELQEPMSYYLFWLILAIVAVAAVFFIQIFFRVILREQLKRHREKKQPKVKPPKKKPLPVLSTCSAWHIWSGASSAGRTPSVPHIRSCPCSSDPS